MALSLLSEPKALTHSRLRLSLPFPRCIDLFKQSLRCATVTKWSQSEVKKRLCVTLNRDPLETNADSASREERREWCIRTSDEHIEKTAN
jgi:hypothetical protein